MMPVTVKAQKDLTVTKNLRAEQSRLVGKVKDLRIDSSIVYPIARYVDAGVDDLYREITRKRAMKPVYRERALLSTVYFLTELNRLMQVGKFDVYSVPSALDHYRVLLDALVKKQPIERIVAGFDQREVQLMAAAFTHFEDHQYLKDLAVYRRVANSPEFILQFLESRPDFRFTDSLLVIAAAHDPNRIIYYLNKDNGVISRRIRNSGDPHIRQIVAISGEKNASELVPFLSQLNGQYISASEISSTRAKVSSYYQLLVNTLMQSVKEGRASAQFTRPLRSGLRQKSLAFYVNPVNELHDSPEAVRFNAVKGLRPEDLYYVITTAGEELYTSSYLGLYKRLKAHFTNGNADSIFHLVGFDNFHVFMRMAANYNVLADFLTLMPRDRARELLGRYISSIDNNPASGVEIAMDIADSFGAIASEPELVSIAEQELLTNLHRVHDTRQYLGMRLYGILSQVFHLVKEDGNVDRLWVKLGNYDLLPQRDLRNKEGGIVEMVLFYGDEDGVASYRNFISMYGKSSDWTMTRTENWVNIRSNTGVPVNIFANVPLSISEGLDIKAQDSLVRHMNGLGLQPTIVVHRGHSYHLEKTLNRLTPTVRLAVLGSCGGYNKAISVASINPDAHIIGSKKTGAMVINDPLIEEINQTLVAGRDLYWPELWASLTQRFSRNQVALGLFNEYFPPSTNIGLFVLKLFRGEA
jgi:hypothetical protein